MKSRVASFYCPLISIVIPARNEAEDIAETIEACLALDYEPKEIIVVDDSTDETPEIVVQYAEKGVLLIHRDENRNGCCGARNAGMQLANGEIIVIINADARPHADFLQRILPHYSNGADYVVVRSAVRNRDNLWASYIYADEMTNVAPDPLWSEGFSCRREAAEAVGYIPGDFPVHFCRDNLFSQSLAKAGFRKHVDRTITVEHIAPNTIRSFWRNRVWRGTISAPHTYYIRGLSLPLLALREGVKAARAALKILLVFPMLLRALRRSRYTSGQRRDIPRLLVVDCVHEAAIVTGNLTGLMRLVRVEGIWSYPHSEFEVPLQTDDERGQEYLSGFPDQG